MPSPITVAVVMTSLHNNRALRQTPRMHALGCTRWAHQQSGRHERGASTLNAELVINWEIQGAEKPLSLNMYTLSILPGSNAQSKGNGHTESPGETKRAMQVEPKATNAEKWLVATKRSWYGREIRGWVGEKNQNTAYKHWVGACDGQITNSIQRLSLLLKKIE